MEKIIEKLYYGEINVGEYFNPMTREPFAKAIKEGQDAEDAFYARLPDDMKHDFELVLQKRVESASMEYVNVFTEGFRLGARVMLDIFSQNN